MTIFVRHVKILSASLKNKKGRRDIMKERHELAIEITKKAAAYLKQMFGQIVSGQEKSYLDLVSEADKAAESIMTALIQKYFPSDKILSEESKEKKGKSPFGWILDSLEATHNYLAGLDPWGCSAAVEEKGVVVFGACAFPNKFFYGEKGGGAFCNSKRIHVSVTKQLRGQMFFCDSAYRFAPEMILRDIRRFCGTGCRLRSTGSFQFNMTRLALGLAGVVTNRSPKPWDVAATSLIVEEAGGIITDEKGNSWQLNSANLLATNGLVHREALKLFQ